MKALTTVLESVGAVCAVAGDVGLFLTGAWWAGLLVAAVILFAASYIVSTA